jgi:hypothetical protein
MDCRLFSLIVKIIYCFTVLFFVKLLIEILITDSHRDPRRFHQVNRWMTCIDNNLIKNSFDILFKKPIISIEKNENAHIINIIFNKSSLTDVY